MYDDYNTSFSHQYEAILLLPALISLHITLFLFTSNHLECFLFISSFYFGFLFPQMVGFFSLKESLTLALLEIETGLIVSED